MTEDNEYLTPDEFKMYAKTITIAALITIAFVLVLLGIGMYFVYLAALIDG